MKVFNVIAKKGNSIQQLDIEGDLKLTETNTMYMFKLDMSDSEKEIFYNQIGEYTTTPFTFNVRIGAETETGAFSYQFCVIVAARPSEEVYIFSGYSMVDLDGTIINIPSYGKVIDNNIYITSIQI